MPAVIVAHLTRCVMIALAGFAGLLVALVPTAASAKPSPTCDAVCAQSTLHTPGRATTMSVRWTRYPYAHQADPSATDPWGSTERQCTGYVTWALNKMGVDFGMADAGANGQTVDFLSALDWAKAARKGGWTVSHKPVLGAVAQWRAHETSHWRIGNMIGSMTAGSDGHVGIVTRIYADGTVLVRQYNVGHPGRSYSSMREKAPRYLYIGV